ncbi:MAG: hypothetical protein HQK82_07470, partial [Desulfovibrionaceae bacterium]|nr:hypothetical protein [Desulfovibrionaceae bacterium]
MKRIVSAPLFVLLCALSLAQAASAAQTAPGADQPASFQQTIYAPGILKPVDSALAVK